MAVSNINYSIGGKGVAVSGILDTQLLEFNASSNSFVPGSQATGAQTGISNLFTATQQVQSNMQTVASFSTTQKLVEMAASSNVDSLHFGGALNFYGANAPAVDHKAWNMGVDTAAATPFRDFFLARVKSDGTVTDWFYISYDNGNGAPATGNGVVPPRANFAFSVSGSDADPTQGGVAIRVATTLTTGVPFSLYDSATSNNAVWFDKSYHLNVDGTIVTQLVLQNNAGTYPKSILVLKDVGGSVSYGFKINSDASATWTNVGLGSDIYNLSSNGALFFTQGVGYPKRSMAFQDVAANATHGFNFNSDGSVTFLYITGAKNFYRAFGDGSFQFQATALGFFSKTAIAQPSAVGAALGYAAGATVATFHSDDTYTGNVGATAYTINGIVAALKNLGLIAS